MWVRGKAGGGNALNKQAERQGLTMVVDCCLLLESLSAASVTPHPPDSPVPLRPLLAPKPNTAQQIPQALLPSPEHGVSTPLQPQSRPRGHS